MSQRDRERERERERSLNRVSCCTTSRNMTKFKRIFARSGFTARESAVKEGYGCLCFPRGTGRGGGNDLFFINQSLRHLFFKNCGKKIFIICKTCLYSVPEFLYSVCLGHAQQSFPYVTTRLFENKNRLCSKTCGIDKILR